jgi:hypothetical protein
MRFSGKSFFSSILHIRPSGLFPSDFISYYGSYRELVRLLGHVISPISRPLLTQDNTNTKGLRRDIPASSGIRTHDPTV